ncbi:signal transduction histidine kinase [Roseibium hamelinense]|uniref:histidine kinase n=1 Tax=Roseibium hamelinense TaxID=150831 RepID=A0A562T1H9_9HYPH|nr:ATP-binding protein [Roseibium hamelinense]MTI44436.1 response regulator [Roseibium hamelinense]TWI87402.1 signal transduction histidine kinase [Roseibium hamelinense]
MTARQRILPVRRKYNQWVNNQTLEDYALRFTAKKARRFSSRAISQTAIGAISFLALEAIGGAITLSHGTANAFVAILVGCAVLLFVGLPIARTAMRHGVDIDLLTRGAGFGYIGSTITSLIYASFTFLLFAIEASIMSSALEFAFGIPLWLGYILSAVAVIPLVTYGITWISRFQIVTQPFWIVLNILPFVFIAFTDWQAVGTWLSFGGIDPSTGVPREAGGWDTLNVVAVAAGASVILALMAQIGEQVDFLRFLPERDHLRRRHRLGLFLAGAGWVVLGAPKLIAGSFLAVLVLSHGVPVEHADEPSRMYAVAFGYMIPNELFATLLMAAFVVVAQLKINVMNAYAGSLAWSNFFSRLTHSHPGRVVWLVFNVGIALLLMELGIYRLLEETLGVFSIISMAWLSAISADLFINKPLGLAPPGIEFKRAHLHDINPVGTGAMLLATGLALAAHFGAFGALAGALATFIAMGVAFVTAPLIAWATGGRFYLARKPRAGWAKADSIPCSICENPFEPEDMAYCPAYRAPICSLCCSLDARCHDMCKPKARIGAQIEAFAKRLMPESLIAGFGSRLGRYSLTVLFSVAVLGAVLWVIRLQAVTRFPGNAAALDQTISLIFFVLAIAGSVAAWFLVLAHDTRVVAEEESARQNALLQQEIDAHSITDAALQKAKEDADAANQAKSRYVIGLSHELRTPLNSVLGYAQLLERDSRIPEDRQKAIGTIRRSADHLSGLIDGLLDISRIEAGRLQVHMSRIDLSDFLSQIVGMMQMQAESKGLEFRYTVAPNLPAFVRTDEKRLRQILVNLLSNAIKFTEAGSVCLSVDYRSQVARFKISDTGPGIALDEQAKIFEPFGRTQQTKINRKPGLGLGLTISRLLTDALGGAIALSSEVGSGSVFEVRVMLSVVEHPEIEVDNLSTCFRRSGSERKVLLVEDNPDHQSLLSDLLKPAGLDVLIVPDAETALKNWDRYEPDLYLLDILLPGMNGWDLAEHLRLAGETAPIIMLSANTADNALGASSSTFHNDVLTKPVNVAELLEKLDHHLRWVSSNRAANKQQVSQPTGNHLLGAEKPTSSIAPEHVNELKAMADIGHVRGLREKLQFLRNDARQAQGLDLLERHLERFDLEAFRFALDELERHD